MKQDSNALRERLFLDAAALAAHTGAQAGAFRQRDLRFFFELFSNWIETELEGFALPIQNNQLARYLKAQVEDGYCKRVARKGPPTYALTPAGQTQMLARMVEGTWVHRRAYFFFLHYFVKHYGPRVLGLVDSQITRYPLGFRKALEELLNVPALLVRELKAAQLELNKLEERIEATQTATQVASQMLARGADVGQVSRELEKQVPYELNSQKPLSELISEIPQDLRAWELTKGNRQRLDTIYKPLREALKTYIQSLELLQRESSA